ncbi:MAG: AAA family ATPase [Meiothermus sp.]|nr:AAA family ATPase [Meiothermus sp.]
MANGKTTRAPEAPPLYTDPAQIEEAVQHLLEQDLADVDLSDPTEGFVPTASSKVIISRLRDAVEGGFGFALVTGPAGCSKTLTTRYFIDNLRRRSPELNSQWLKCHPIFDQNALLEALAVVNVISRTRKFRDLLRSVESQMRTRRLVMVLDEAQNMPREALEVLKYLGDETGATFILVCTEDYQGNIRRYRDIESRIGVVAEAAPTPLRELAELELVSGFGGEAVETIHKLTGGVLRDVFRLVRQVDLFIANNKRLARGSLTPKTVRLVATKINLEGGRE